MLAALSVVFSLALVAYELKLSRDTAIADVYQQGLAATLEYQASALSNERLQDALETRREDPSQLSKRDLYLIIGFLDGWLWMKEAQFFQHQLGMSDDTEWEVHQRAIISLGEWPCYRYAWNHKGLPESVHSDFAAEVTKLWADLPETECQFGDWN